MKKDKEGSCNIEMALGWAHAYFCIALDEGSDPRLMEVPKMYEDAKADLGF